MLTKLARVLNISPAFIARFPSETSFSKSITSDKSNILPSKTRLVPVVSEIAWGESITANDNTEDYLQEPDNSLSNVTVFYLKAKGYSMKPTILNRTDVLI